MHRIPAPAFAGLALAALGGALPGQRPAFVELLRSDFVADADPTYAVAHLDFDADGNPDLYFGNDRTGDRLYHNTGLGEYVDVSSTRLPPSTGAAARAVVAGDFDGDGFVDVFVARGLPGGQNELLLNVQGTRLALATARIPIATEPTTAAAVGDVDGDGDLDVLYVNDGQPDVLLINDGTARFTAAPPGIYPSSPHRSTSVALLDVDGDGDLDAVTGQAKSAGNPRDLVYLNDGTGRFLDGSAARMPAFGSVTAAVVCGDFDLDGDPDLFLGQSVGIDALLLNDGNGTFSLAPPGTLPADPTELGAATALDLDGDGDLDLALGIARTFGGINLLYTNDGSGRFSRSPDQPTGRARTRGMLTVDANVDGLPDLVEANDGQQNRLLINQGRGQLLDTIRRAPSVRFDGATSLHVADFDGDGYPDVLVADTWNGSHLLMLNDGGGFFRDGRLPASVPGTTSFAAGDADGDGHPDLFVGVDGQDRLWRNDGTGSFQDVTTTALPALLQNTSAAVFADVDGDGDLDLVVAVDRGPNRLLTNDGTGHFVDASYSRMPPDLRNTLSVTAVDLDADGDLDLLFANRREDSIYLNDGQGYFFDVTTVLFPTQRVVSTWTTNIVAGDIDGDGDLDLLFADDFSGDRVYLNDGTTHFTDATTTNVRATADGSGKIALADIDLDGDLDVLRAGSAIWLNDGAGIFSDAPAGSFPMQGDDHAVADFDRDGDLDILSDTGLFTCVARQLASDGNARIGLTYEVRAITRQGTAQVVPVVGTRRLALEIPGLGVLGLDPAGGLVALPPITVPQPSGEASFTLGIPLDLNLLGADLLIQGIHVGRTTTLTNLLADRVRR